MGLRKVLPGDIVGKTVTSIDTSAENVLVLTFSGDGGSLYIWAEVGAFGIPMIVVDDSDAKEDDE